MATTKPKRGEKVRAGKVWTEARYWSFVRSQLRAGWMKYPPKQMALKAARKVVRGKRHRFEYQCAECSSWFMGKEVQVDHITPCGNLSNDPGGFIERLYCEPEDLQILCKPCHKIKTDEERKQ